MLIASCVKNWICEVSREKLKYFCYNSIKERHYVKILKVKYHSAFKVLPAFHDQENFEITIGLRNFLIASFENYRTDLLWLN